MDTSSGLSPLEQERAEFGYNVEEIRGKSLRVIHQSNSDECDECVFFFHGGGGRACQFKHQIRALTTRVNIVAVDFLGHGDSPAPNQPELYTANEHFLDTYELFMKHKKTVNYIVCHCYGSIHTLRLIKRLRDEGLHTAVKGVVIIALGVNSPVGSSSGPLMKLPHFILEWLRPLARSSSNAKLFSSQTSPELIAFENSISDHNKMYVMKVLGTDCCDAQRWADWLQEGKEGLSNDIEIDIIAGEEDGLFPVDNCLELSRMFGVSEERFHVLPGAAHLSMLEKADEVTKIIMDNYINKK